MQITEKFSRETGREYALRILKDNIVRLELKPGEKVSENDLASAMGLSRTPIREALVELSRAGVVEVIPQKGSFISKIDYATVEESLFARQIMEIAVIEVCCDTADESDIRRLDENIRLQKYYLQGEADLTELDKQFHKMLFEIAKKTRIYELTDVLNIHYDRVRFMAARNVSREKIVQEHDTMVTCIVNHDAEAAKKCMEEHLSHYSVDAVKLKEEFPEYFTD